MISDGEEPSTQGDSTYGSEGRGELVEGLKRA